MPNQLPTEEELARKASNLIWKDSSLSKGACDNIVSKVLTTIPLAELLAVAALDFKEEFGLMRRMEALHVERGSIFGVAISQDSLAVEWRKLDKQLRELTAKRIAAFDALHSKLSTTKENE